jgi:hypothetical protein
VVRARAPSTGSCFVRRKAVVFMRVRFGCREDLNSTAAMTSDVTVVLGWPLMWISSSIVGIIRASGTRVGGELAMRRIRVLKRPSFSISNLRVK